MRAAAALLGASAIWVGCSTITSAPQYDSTKLEPLAKHVSVTADPLPDSDGKLVRDAVLHVVIDDDYPDPEIVVFGQLLLQSGTATFDVDMKVSLVDRAIFVQPRSLLAPNTQYELVIDQHFRTLSGRTMGQSMSFTLSVGDQLAPSPSPSPTPVPYTWYDNIFPLFKINGCSTACHLPDSCTPGVKRNPTSDFSIVAAPDDPVLGLINVPSELMKGEARPLLRVKPGDSANSLLLRKLLGGDPHAGRASGEPVPDNLAVPGRRMPLYEIACSTGPNDTLPPPEQYYFDAKGLREVQNWIDQGAPIGTPSN
jgi:hypothetical protein